MNVNGIVIKFILGIICLVFQINLMGKSNLAPSSPMDQIQNYVLGGIIGGVIYNESVTVLQFLVVLLIWTILVMIVKYLKENFHFMKVIVDGKTSVLIKDGVINVGQCMKQGIQGRELMLKLRENGISDVSQVKRAIIEQNGQLTITEYGDESTRYPVIIDGQPDMDILEMIHKDLDWLNSEVNKAGLKNINKIFVGEYVSGELKFFPYPT